MTQIFLFVIATIVALFFGWGGVEVINALARGEIDAGLVVVLKVFWVLLVVVVWAAVVTGHWNPLPRNAPRR